MIDYKDAKRPLAPKEKILLGTGLLCLALSFYCALSFISSVGTQTIDKYVGTWLFGLAAMGLIYRGLKGWVAFKKSSLDEEYGHRLSYKLASFLVCTAFSILVGLVSLIWCFIDGMLLSKAPPEEQDDPMCPTRRSPETLATKHRSEVIHTRYDY